MLRRIRHPTVTTETDPQHGIPIHSGERRSLHRCCSRPFRRRYATIILLLGFTLALWCTHELSATERRIIFREEFQYHWNRILWRWQAPKPRGTLAAAFATRRQVLESESPSMARENYLVERHLKLLGKDMSRRYNNDTDVLSNKTVVLLWSGNYPVWFADVRMGIDKTCNVPCEWTIDRNFPRDKVSGLVCLQYRMEEGQCRDIDPDFFDRPILGVSWENDWKNHPAGLDEMPESQIWKLKRESPYNLISSHELDSHIPILYKELGDFIDQYKIQTMEQLIQERLGKRESVMFAISNCDAPLRPDRLKVTVDLSKHLPTSSYGKCLGKESNYGQSWNSRGGSGNKRFIEEISKYLFVYVPENSYGLDYVTEKVYNALMSGATPIYIGAPNIAAFLPDLDAAIHVSYFGSVKELGDYLLQLSRNLTLLVERHHAWRTRPLPNRFLRLAKLVDRKSDYSYMCKVCNCFQGRIGCP